MEQVVNWSAGAPVDTLRRIREHYRGPVSSAIQREPELRFPIWKNEFERRDGLEFGGIVPFVLNEELAILHRRNRSGYPALSELV